MKEVKDERYYKIWKSWDISEKEWYELPANKPKAEEVNKDVEKVMEAIKGAK